MITANLRKGKKEERKEIAPVKWIEFLHTANFFFRGRLPLPSSSSSSSYSCCCLSHRSCWEDYVLPSFLPCLLACFTQISTSNSRWYILTCINTCDGRNEPTRNSAADCGHRLRMKEEENLWFISFSRRNPGWELALKLGEAGHRNPKPSVVGISATCSGTLFLFKKNDCAKLKNWLEIRRSMQIRRGGQQL